MNAFFLLYVLIVQVAIALGIIFPSPFSTLPFFLFYLFVHHKEMSVPSTLFVYWWNYEDLSISQLELDFMFMLDLWCMLSSLGTKSFWCLAWEACLLTR